MKTLIILILGLLLLSSYPDYTGEWSFENSSQSFVLTLQQRDSIVTGKHFAIMENGNRMDGSDDEQTIYGKIKDNQLVVSIKSTYESSAPGVAKLTLVGKDSLYFEFITPPEGTYWIPNKVWLTKEK